MDYENIAHRVRFPRHYQVDKSRVLKDITSNCSNIPDFRVEWDLREERIPEEPIIRVEVTPLKKPKQDTIPQTPYFVRYDPKKSVKKTFDVYVDP